MDRLSVATLALFMHGNNTNHSHKRLAVLTCHLSSCLKLPGYCLHHVPCTQDLKCQVLLLTDPYLKIYMHWVRASSGTSRLTTALHLWPFSLSLPEQYTLQTCKFIDLAWLLASVWRSFDISTPEQTVTNCTEPSGTLHRTQMSTNDQHTPLSNQGYKKWVQTWTWFMRSEQSTSQVLPSYIAQPEPKNMQISPCNIHKNIL